MSSIVNVSVTPKSNNSLNRILYFSTPVDNFLVEKANVIIRTDKKYIFNRKLWDFVAMHEMGNKEGAAMVD